MKNKTPLLNQRIQAQIPDWVYQEMQEDDFLMGRTPQKFSDSWEEEE